MHRVLAAYLAVAPIAVAFADAPQPPAVDARAWLLIDASNGQPIASRNPDQRIEPASLTKLMTAYVAFAALKSNALALSQRVPVSERAWRAGGSRMFIEPRRPVTVEELLHGMVVQSGNDACIALAEAVAGSEEAFAERMNREAQRLGMKNTHFTNSSGLPEAAHYSTASDLALLAGALIRDYPEYYKLYSEREYRYNNITQQNRNRLLLSVVLGAGSDRLRAQDSQTLLNFGFLSYDGVRLFEKGQPISTLSVWKGRSPALKAGPATDLFVTVPKGTADKLKAELVSQQPLLAPLAAGQRVGTLRVLYEDKSLAEYPVVALEGVAAAGFFGRAWDSVRLWFR